MTTVDLDSPEALAVIKGEPHAVGFRGGTLRLPRLLLMMSSGPNLVEVVPREVGAKLDGWIVFDVGLARGYRESCNFWELEGGRGTGRGVRTDIRPECIVVYLEPGEDAGTLVRLFRTLRDHCDPGLRMCDNRGEALFEGDVK